MSPEEDLTYYIILASFIMPLLLSAGLVWFFVTYNKKRTEYELSLKDEELKRQRLLLERQNALEAERTRIAAEMHDDLGGGLTTIKFLSQKVLRKLNDEQQKASVEKIVTNSQTLVTNMSEIIWAMNAGFDTVDNLVAYSRRYTYEFLEEYPIEVQFSVGGKVEGVPLSGEQRRNLFLILKEALHNIVKYAEATIVQVAFAVDHRQLSLSINDDGVGLPSVENILGNGLKNMHSRAKMLGGVLIIQSEHGLQIKLTVPLEE